MTLLILGLAIGFVAGSLFEIRPRPLASDLGGKAVKAITDRVEEFQAQRWDALRSPRRL